MAGTVKDTRLRILEYIVTYMEGHRYSPTRDEIAKHIGLSVRSSVQYHIDSLVADGYLERPTYRHRMIKPTEHAKKAIMRLREIDAD